MGIALKKHGDGNGMDQNLKKSINTENGQVKWFCRNSGTDNFS